MVTMRRVWRRALAAAALGVVAAAGSGVAAGGPAGAQAPGAPEQPLGLAVEPSTGLSNGDVVQLTMTGSGSAVDDTLYLAQCDAAVGDAPTVEDLFANCGNEALVLPGTRPTTQSHRIVDTFTSFTGRVVSCGASPDACVMTVSGAAGQPFASVPLGIEPGPLSLVARPSANLVDGTPVQVQVLGSRSAPVGVAQCGPAVATGRDVFAGPCGPVIEVPAGTAVAEVDLAVTAVVEGGDGTVVSCGDDCVIAASTAGGAEFASTPIEFAGTAPELHATPATELTDGQAVQVVATDVLPSIDGPPLGFLTSTGRWAVLQCGGAVADDPTLPGILTHCAAPPGGGPVAGDGADLVVDVEIQATVTSLFGTTADCTAGAGACVVALARVDPDATVSVLTSPLAFAAPAG
jgi:hypothetical protein